MGVSGKESPIWAYRNARGKILLWHQQGRFWFRYLHAAENQNDESCWWGEGEEGPDEWGLEYIGKVSRLIESDEKGQKQIEELLEEQDAKCWTEWESGFIASLEGKQYATLSTRQKASVTDLHDKLTS